MSVQLISHELNDVTPGYGGKKSFFIEKSSSILDGDSSNSQKWTMSNHSGTHIDSPLHFDKDGYPVTKYEAQEWVFTSVQLMDYEAESGEIISPESIGDLIKPEADLLLIRTGFEKRRGEDIYWENNPGLSPELGKYIRKNFPNVRVIGFDFISVTSFSSRPLGRVAHKEFLAVDKEGEPIRVIEDMKLSELKGHPSKVIVAPLFVTGCDGSPVTVFSFS